MRIQIYSKEGCTYCDHAVELCESEGVNHEKIMIERGELEKLCGGKFDAYPQIFKDGERLGNFFDLEEFIQERYEPLLDDEGSFTLFPLKYEHLWTLYKKAQMSNWTAEEIDFSRDMEDWKGLSENEQRFVKYVLAFFAGSDGIVFENINNNFADEVKSSEAKSFYAYQCHNEMVHSETYSKLIDKYISDGKEKMNLFNAIDTIPCIEKKAKWALKWFDKTRPFAERLFAFACVEGIFFSGSFCAIYWLKKRGLMPGLTFSNELISRDEGLHQEFAVELFKMLRHKPSGHVLQAIVREAVAIEKEFILDALPCSLIGMNAQKMSEYIEYVSDRLLKQIGQQPIFNSKNPFDFMELISLEGKTNFFEKRVGDYGKMDVVEDDINFNEDF
jgi:ribonucleotide reductase beta subunit family protein with ferritin-like domain/glutaredoxin